MLIFSMKIAITGKGGVGKTTLSAILSHLYAKEGKKVVAVDADPDANLAQAFGLSQSEISQLKAISELTELIEERTGAKPGSMGGVFRLNPKVDDIPEEYGKKINGITLLVMGKTKEAATGCYCPENVFLRRLLRHLVVERDEVVIVDMEAGIEHLSRGTAEAVDAFVVVVEPGQRSLQTAITIKEMAQGLGVKKVYVVANKIRGEEDLSYIEKHLEGMDLLGRINFRPEIMEADMKGIAPFVKSSEAVKDVLEIKTRLEESLKYVQA
jgi:CO dehydrogenase maturation factor